MDFFISYRRNGGFLFSSKLYSQLSELGFRVFWDSKKMKSGRFDKQICAQLREASCVIAICSDAMFAEHRQTDWVVKELLTARSLNKPIFVIVLKGVRMDSISCPDCLDFLYDQPRIDLNTVPMKECIDRICCMVSDINQESICQTYSSRNSADVGSISDIKSTDRLILLSCPVLQNESHCSAVAELLHGDHNFVPIYIDFQTVRISDRCYRPGKKNNRIIPGIIASDIRHIPLHSVSDGLKRAVETTLSCKTDNLEFLLILDHFGCLPQYSNRGFALSKLITYEIMEMLRTCPSLCIAVLLPENDIQKYFPSVKADQYRRLQVQTSAPALKHSIDPAKLLYCGFNFGFDAFSVRFIMEFLVPLAVQKSRKTGAPNNGYRITCSEVAKCLKALSNPSSTIYSAEARMLFSNYTDANDPRINIASVCRRMCMSKHRMSTAKRTLDFCRSIGILAYNGQKFSFVSGEVYDYFSSQGERISEWA